MAESVEAIPSQGRSPATSFAGGRRSWVLVTALLLAGLAISAGAALLWRARVADHEREAFRSTAADVSATLAIELRRETDFIGTLRALVAMHPHLGATAFARWYRQLHGRQRQIGGEATGVVSVVHPRELAAFQARRRSDPAFRRLAGGDVEVFPQGRRRRYCLVSAGVSRQYGSPLVQEAARMDWCTPAIPGLAEDLRAESESGRLVSSPPALATVFMGAAVYRPGSVIGTPSRRRAATIAWIWTSFDVPALIQSALGGHRRLAVTLYHANPGTSLLAIGSAGHADQGASTVRRAMTIEGRWLASVRGTPIAAGLSADVQALLVLAAGLLVTLLVCALAIVLMRSRQHALGLVDERTGQLRHQALHDALTGLPNRVLALDEARRKLARAKRLRTPVAALYVDLDNFKHVNDTFGHAAGDELLQIVARRLAGVVREGDTAARLGGDEFVVLMEGPHRDGGPETVAERMLEVLRLPYAIGGGGGRALAVTASVGIAVGQRETADELLRDADVALYEAKAAGRNRYVSFEPRMQTAVQERLTLEMDLVDALEQGQLSIVYQPTFDLATERVIGAEALLRWNHPSRGLLRPAEFVPIAEQSGKIVPIGRWVLAQACEQAARWHRRGHRIGVAVNVSARQIDRNGLVDEVRVALQDSGLAPEALTLEVTETTVMRDAPVSARRLRALKRLGVRIAIDDFGTGYSSLAYLREFPVDTLKVDRSFVSGMTASKEAAALVRTLIQLGGTLELKTLAEGIESRDQLDALRQQGCDCGQGFLFSRPLDVAAMDAFLKQSARADASAQADASAATSRGRAVQTPAV